MSLFSLVNQNKNLEFIQTAIKKNRLANAYLFYGPEGSGHEVLALETAARLNCFEKKRSAPCGKCHACQKMKRLEHSNLQLVFPLPGKRTKSVSNPFQSLSDKQMEEIQSAIQQKARHPYDKFMLTGAKHIPIDFIRYIKKNIYLKSNEIGWKVVILLDAHLLTSEAANAFLKVLEEPPSDSTFILTTNHPDRLLPTIKSRCQPLYFPPLSDTDIKSALTAREELSEPVLKAILHLSGGNLSQAQQLTETYIKKIKKQTLIILRAVAGWDVKKIVNLIERLITIQREDPQLFLMILHALHAWFRDATIIKTGVEPQSLIHSDQQETLNKFVAAYPDLDPFTLSDAVENCIDFIERNAYINLVLLDMFFKINKALRKKRISPEQ